MHKIFMITIFKHVYLAKFGIAVPETFKWNVVYFENKPEINQNFRGFSMTIFFFIFLTNANYKLEE